MDKIELPSYEEAKNKLIYNMEKNELKKELMKNKVEAEFSHYCAGNLYYRIVTSEGTYQFPIATVDNEKWAIEAGMSSNDSPPVFKSVRLSSDLGTTAFNTKERASMLWRWIDKAIDKGEYIKL
jgi:hypothetical protein